MKYEIANNEAEYGIQRFKVKNIWKFTEKAAEKVPIKIGDKVIGRVLMADDNYIYCIITDMEWIMSEHVASMSFELETR